MSIVSIILDAVLIGVVLLCVALGVKRGFVKSIVRMIGSLASLVVAFLVSSPIAEFLFNNLFRQSVETAVKNAIDSDVTASVSSLATQWGNVLAGLPDMVRNSLASVGVGSAEQLGQEVVKQGAVTVGDAVTVIVDKLIAPLCIMLIQVIVFILLFILLSFVVRLIAKALSATFSAIPLVRELNTGLGAVAGLLQGVMMVFVLTAGLQLYMTMAGAASFVTAVDLDGTWMTGWLMSINPLF